MVTVFLLVLLTVLMASSPRAFVFVTVVLGSVLISKFEYLFEIKNGDGNMIRNIATNLAGILHVVRALFIGKRLNLSRNITPYVALVAISILGLIISIDLLEGLRFVSILTIPLLVFFVSRIYFKPNDYFWAMRTLVVVCFFQIIAGIIEFVFEPGVRISGFHDVPAVYGWFLSLAIILAVFLSKVLNRKPFAATILMLLGGVVIVLTGARVALIIFPLALWYFLTEYKMQRAVLIPLLLITLFLVALTFSFQLDQGTARLGVEVATSDFEFVGEAGGTLAWRFLLWDRLLTGWLESPILGYGPGADYAVSLAGRLTSDLNYSETNAINTHNEYVKLLFNHGIVGLALFLIFVFRLLRLKRSANSKETLRLARVIAFFTVSWLAFSLTDNGLSYHGQTSIIFLCLAFFSQLSATTSSVPSTLRPS